MIERTSIVMRGSNCLYVIFLLGLLTACTGKKTEQSDKQAYALLPVPVSMQSMPGSFELQESTKIIVGDGGEEMGALASYLSSEMQRLVNLNLQISQEKADTTSSNSIQLILDPNVMPGTSTKIENESYSLTVKPKGVIIRGKTSTGLFYGMQTFLQLVYPNQQADVITLPATEIQDRPAFAWRGLHMDVCRHFFPVEFIKKMIDAMALHKMNTFHWHLTDDQGWRIEIKKYPLLTSVGGWRKETVVGHMSSHPLTYDKKRYGGFYTQEQIKDVVAYAKSRYITVVPEIEMPGHALAALAAYPEYSCTGGPFEVFTEWGETPEAFCGGKEKTFGFIQDILDEVITLFPGTYVHVGGDECSKKRWIQCADCKQRMKQEHLKDVNAMQSYFIKRIETYLSTKGKKLIGWDEILQGGLPEQATVMSWRGLEGGIEASNSGHDAVMTPGKYCYFDKYQGNPDVEPLAIGGLLPLDSVYGYSPSRGIDPEKAKHILGAQANVWTEYIPTEKHFEYMVFPRLCAMAEILWSPAEKRNYVDFIQRLDTHYQRLDKKDIAYRVDAPIGFQPYNRVLEDSTTVSLNCSIPSAEIRYTLDGTMPGRASSLYTKPLQLSLAASKKVIAKTFLKNGKESKALTGVFEKAMLLPGVKLPNPQKGLQYNYYDQQFSSAKAIVAKPTKSGISDSIAFPKWIDLKKEWFGLEYNGYVKIDKEELYTFYLNADDGAALYIDDVLIIDNDGYHYAQEKVGNVGLGEGYHSLRLVYFEGKYTPVLEVKIMCQGLKKQALPSNMLWHN